MAQTRWAIFLDPASSDDARAMAWRALRKRIRPPVLFQLRRRIEGWRLTEDLADEVCERVRERFAAGGVPEEAKRLRVCVERELTLYLEEQGKNGSIDPEFERDWASGLLFAALREFGHQDPEAHRAVLRLYDRPEGQPPMSDVELAHRLGQPAGAVEQLLARGRGELRELFEREIAETVADGALLAEEVAHLLPRARALFGAGTGPGERR